jgi:predicted PurR-regulated permease PerM
MTKTDQMPSPSWGTTTKLVIGLTLVAIFAGVFLYFRSVVSLVILAFIITYLLQPLVVLLSERTKMSWRLSTTLVFLIFVILLMGLLTGAGLAIAQQVSGLVRLLEELTADLPKLADDLTAYLEQFGAGNFIDLNDLANRLLEAVQPLLGQAGSLVGSIATGAATGIGRTVFVVLVSYFILSEAQKVGEVSPINIPDYDYDITRMSRQLKGIWASFFRGQIIIFVLVFFVYLAIYSALGVRFSIALAALTGLAVFIPYVGIWVTSIVLVLVTFFQPSNYFGFQPWQYSAMILGITLVVNFTFDNYISPRFFGRTLDIHPAAVVLSALFMASLLGLVGIFLAAPVVATVKVVGLYVFRKMVDLDPWPEPEVENVTVEFPWSRWTKQLKNWFTDRQSRKKDQNSK